MIFLIDRLSNQEDNYVERIENSQVGFAVR